MKKLPVLILLLISGAPLCTSPGAKHSATASCTSTIGGVESIKLKDWSTFKARIDTGAKYSSVHGYYNRDKNFITVFKDKGRAEVIGKFRLLKTVRIKSRGTEEKRPLIELELKLGGVHYRTKFTIADRSNMKFPALIGRDFLAGRFLVDPARQFLCN